MAPWQLCTFLLRPWRRDNCSCSHGRMSYDLLEHEIMRSLWKAVTRPFSTCLPISLGSRHETFSQPSSLMSCEAVWLAFLGHSCRFWNYLSTTWHQLLSNGASHIYAVLLRHLSPFVSVQKDTKGQTTPTGAFAFLEFCYLCNSLNFKRVFPFFTGWIFQTRLNKESAEENDDKTSYCCCCE